jgi:hypothetical protein
MSSRVVHYLLLGGEAQDRYFVLEIAMSDMVIVLMYTYQVQMSQATYSDKSIIWKAF